MSYSLKSGLGKTKIYNALCAYNQGGISLPSLQKCNFFKIRNIYWLSWFDDKGKFFACRFSADADECRFCFFDEYIDTDGNEVRTCIYSVRVPLGYLKDNQYLREVS